MSLEVYIHKSVAAFQWLGAKAMIPSNSHVLVRSSNFQGGYLESVRGYVCNHIQSSRKELMHEE